MNEYLIISIVIVYLIGLFIIAFSSEKKLKSFTNNGYFYALSLMVYCTAWTFFGSVGWAARDGISFLAIYIGPLLTVPFWWIILRKMVRITKTLRISSIADFISIRYGKNLALGRLVAITSFFAVIPYIALQLKAVDSSIELVSPDTKSWAPFFVLILLTVFAILFGAANVDANQRKPGLVTAIVFESIVKLIAFAAIGFFVVFGLFDGFGDLFTKAAQTIDINQLSTFKNEWGYSDWFFICLVSGIAFFLLPRQFQVSSIEAGKEKHILSAMKIVPLYFLLINFFVLPIALGGLLLLPEASDSDFFVLLLPLKEQANWLVVLGLLGGFSAATGMILLSTTALSTMLSNYIFIPLILRTNKEDASQRTDYQNKLLFWRRVSIIIIMSLAYLYYQYFTFSESLVGIGLISFVAIAQLAPAFFGGLFWKKANAKAASNGLIAGLLMWGLFLIYPNTSHSVDAIQISSLDGFLSFISESLGLSQLSTGIFISLIINTLLYVIFSYQYQQNPSEVNQAELFVDIFKYSGRYDRSVARKVSAHFPDIKSLFHQFIGEERTETVLNRYAQKHGINWEDNPRVDTRVISYAERVLTGVIGSSSAKIMVAKVVQEEEIGIDEVVNIIQESQETMKLNRELTQKQQQLARATDRLKEANQKLMQYGELKNEFLYTVTHELRTPITSIKAMAEIMQDHTEMEQDDREQFVENIIFESERMSRLISNVLDLEKFESGNQGLELTSVNLQKIIEEELQVNATNLAARNINSNLDISVSLPMIEADQERMRQVVNNLVSNAIKYCDPKQGEIKLTAYRFEDGIKVNIANNGSKLTEGDLNRIFDKFYQVKNQKGKKQVGHGLGLAITKNIIEMHQGRISASINEDWVKFKFYLPLKRTSNES